MAEAKTGGKGGDGPNVREEVASNTEPVEMPEAGMSSIQKVIYVVSFFFNSFIFLSFKFYFIFKLYIIVLVLPNIKMNPPQVYMCSPS